MSLKKLKSNFKRELSVSYMFLEESICERYLMKVADLLHHNETYKAGEVLAVLAATIAGGKEKENSGYHFRINRVMFGDLDIWMASFILSFDGKGREHLLDVLRGIHSEEPFPVMLFRFHSLDRFGPISCDRTNYGTLLLRKCIQMKELMVSDVNGSRSYVEVDTEAGPSQPKVRRVDSTSQHRKNTAVLSVNQHAFVTLYLLEKMYPNPPLYHSKSICMVVEAMLCLGEIVRKLVVFPSWYIDCLFDERWEVFTSEIEESIRNKSFVELYSTVFLKHWNASDTFYNDRNGSLLTLLTTTKDLPIGWRAQLCGNVVCSALKIPSTMDLYSSEADVDVYKIVQMAALVAKVFIKDCIAECCDTVTKILEACLVCSNKVTYQRVFDVFWDYRSDLNYAKHNELMLRLLLKYLRLSSSNLCPANGEILDGILTFAGKIGLQFAVVSFKNWDILSETFDMHHLSTIFNTACLALKPPLPDDVIDALVSYLCAASHHDLECMDVLKAIPEGPRRKRALESVYVNADNYSCQALFHVARTAEDNNSGIPLSDCNILSDLGHQLLQKAFGRYCNPTNADILQGRCLLSGHWVLDVLNWFFCRISEIGTEERAAGDQFQTFMHSIGNIFKFETQLSFLSHMQNSSSLLSAIREVVSEGGDIYINPFWYNWFSTT
ncbi:uncharacterized protein LOC110456369 isoform X2 [Mizuhopecten yessoensis]|uniref:uncharacterized protein LOC110456369 isoform X2 n=1 Tax=Mizuhopecten yessoensis TaxID=6573 RepID=UPI000B457421|nr:uncharacterized protein LOC110456369 isoform X2 [Mizuhopecten yessoensis]